MVDEKLSIAPMLEWTDPHYRMLMRGITRKTVLYTEMIVDDTILHAPNILDFTIGRNIDEEDSVIQIGGHNPDTMAEAAHRLDVYSGGRYGELNINCGCPSQKVAQRCFGAKLMLEPELVREMVSKMTRRISMPVTIKCRLGVDDHDSYEELKNFIFTTSQAGVKKYIIHSRKCCLHGLTTKQNRDIPPLRYDLTHRLVEDFPDFTFVLNGGISSFQQGLSHLSSHYEHEGLTDPLLPVHGVMIGRMAYNNPISFATADSTFYGVKDPCLTRRQIIDRYLTYCEWTQSDQGPKRVVKDNKVQIVSTMVLLNAMRNCIADIKNVNKFRKELNDVYVRKLNEDKSQPNPNPREVVSSRFTFVFSLLHNIIGGRSFKSIAG
jgi:tRNA-dihydrouridine synthase A